MAGVEPGTVADYLDTVIMDYQARCDNRDLEQVQQVGIRGSVK